MSVPPYQSIHGLDASLEELSQEPALRHAGEYHVVLQHQPNEGANKRFVVSFWRTEPLLYLERAHARTLASARRCAAHYMAEGWNRTSQQEG